jgi:hypothetical protein
MACVVIEKLIQTVRSLLSPVTGPNFKPMNKERGKVLFNVLVCSAHSSILNMEEVYFSETSVNLPHVLGRAIAQKVSRRPPTGAGRVRARFRLCGICGRQSGTGAGFLRVLQFPLPILIPPTASHSLSSSRAGTIGQLVADVPSGLILTPPQETN